MSETMPMISVIIPVYQAEGCLQELYRRLVASVESVTKDFELILVEDHGTDQSWDLITHLSQSDPRVRGAQLSRNFGQHYAITAGLDLCRGEWVVVMDCDLQDRPEEIPRLFAKAQEGYDIVRGVRVDRKHSLINRACSWLFYRILSWLSDLSINGNAGNFCMISRRVVVECRRLREQLRLFGCLLEWLGFQKAEIEIVHDPRFHGKSSYSFRKLWKLAMDVIVAYSDKPLRLSIGLGALVSTVSFFIGVVIFFRAINYQIPVPGWSSVMVSLFFLGGCMIGILGILGLYLGKVFNEAKGRPLYVIGRDTNSLNL